MQKGATAAPTENEIIGQLNAARQEMSAIAQKVGELEMEKEEHKLVIDTLSPLQGDRKCFRLVGDVLVERTVGDVLPTLIANSNGIGQVLQQLSETYQKKEADFAAFQKKHNIQIRPSA